MTVTLGIATMVRADEGRLAPELRAIRFLAREVPAWNVQNKCFSCHNNGDGARALHLARRQGYDVPAEALSATDAWLLHPALWEQDLGEVEFKDGRLARVQFAAALTAAARNAATGTAGPRDPAYPTALHQAAALLVKDQAEDGSWPLITGGLVAAPATYGPILATHFSRELLHAASADAHRSPLARSQQWLEEAKVQSVVDAAAVLWALAHVEGSAAAKQRQRALELLRDAQSADGGWGPYRSAAAETFDTALALIALTALGDKQQSPLVARGRSWLLARQQADGSWPATTRPAGVDSYAEFISTTAWALHALLVADRPAK